MGKTIVTTFDEISRMMDFCHDSKGDISRSFYDWYLKEVPAYFADNGMLIVDGLVGKKEKVFSVSEEYAKQFLHLMG